MKKNLGKFLGLGCLLAATSLTSCNSGGKLVGITYYKMADNNMSTYWRPAYVEAAKEYGWDARHEDCADTEAELINKLKNFVNLGAEGLLVNLVKPTQGATAIKIAKDAKLPIVIWNKEPVNGEGKIDSTSLNSHEQAFFVGTDAAEAGRMQAKQFYDYMKANPTTWDRNGDGKVRAYVIHGEQGHVEADARTKYCIDYLKELLAADTELKNVQVISTTLAGYDQAGSWSQPAAVAAYESSIKPNEAGTSENKADVIFSNNDDMAVSIANATGYPTNLPIYGVDCSTAGIQALKDGKLTGSVLNDSTTQAQVAAYLLNELMKVNDGTVEGYTTAKALEATITKYCEGTTAKAVYDTGNKAFRVNYVIATKANIDTLFPSK